jgi:hypothetical protein
MVSLLESCSASGPGAWESLPEEREALEALLDASPPEPKLSNHPNSVMAARYYLVSLKDLV